MRLVLLRHVCGLGQRNLMGDVPQGDVVEGRAVGVSVR